MARGGGGLEDAPFCDGLSQVTAETSGRISTPAVKAMGYRDGYHGDGDLGVSVSDGKAHAKFTLPALILGYSAEIKMDVDDHAAFFNRCFFGRDAHLAHGNPFSTLPRGEIALLFVFASV